MKTPFEAHKLSRIEKRAIEALAVAPVIKAVAQLIGKKEALAILQEVNQKEAFQRGQHMRSKVGRTGIAELVDEVAGWGEGGTWEMKIIERTPETYYFNVTRCPYHEKYRELGLEEFGAAMSCCRDKPFASGFHPQLKLERSQTIMEGAEYCDFRYSLHAA